MTFEELYLRFKKIISTEYSLNGLSNNFVEQLNSLQSELVLLRNQIANSEYYEAMLLNLGRTLFLLDIISSALTAINPLTVSSDIIDYSMTGSIQRELSQIDISKELNKNLENSGICYLFDCAVQEDLHQRKSLPGEQNDLNPIHQDV